MTRPLSIAVPLLSRRRAKDWVKICRLLEQTLRSIANQSVSCRRVLIGCHEVPELAIPAGLDVEFIPVDFAPPIFTWEMELDKLRKQEVMGARHRAHGGGLLYFLDADDLLDRDFIATIGASPAKAFILRRGYELDFARQRVSILPRFWRRCGSSAVIDWTIDELPEAPLTEKGSIYREFLDTRHYRWHEFCAARGWTIDYVDRPVAAYVVNHGQNDSMVLSKFSWKWKLFNMLTPSKALTADFRTRFGLTS